MPRISALFAWLLFAGSIASLSPRAAQADLGQTGLAAHPPRVKLDRLRMPADLAFAKELEAHLRATLRHETRRADWGAAPDAKISYRFFVERLELREEAGVLHVTCTALGRLPKGKSARSQIAFGGDPRQRKEVIERVLEIVARGVVTRLAELERARRTP